MGKYVLIGIPGCGKTTLGRRVAEISQIPFFDTDSMAYDKLDELDPLDLFEPSVLEDLRGGELKVMLKLTEVEGSGIIAVGAEFPLRPKCAAIMKSMGTVIHIRRDKENVIDTRRKSGKRGAALVNEKGEEKFVLRDAVVELYADELPQYEALADYTIENNGSEEESIEKLAALIKLLSSAAGAPHFIANFPRAKRP